MGICVAIRTFDEKNSTTIDHDNPFNHSFVHVDENGPTVRKLIKENIGPRRWAWLKKACGAFVINSYVIDSNSNNGYSSSYSLVSKDNDYIASLNLHMGYQYEVKFVYNHRLVEVQSRDPGNVHVIGIGYNKKEKAWYGWSHRGFGKFYVGYEIKKGSSADNSWHKYPFTVKTLDQAKEIAKEFAETIA